MIPILIFIYIIFIIFAILLGILLIDYKYYLMEPFMLLCWVDKYLCMACMFRSLTSKTVQPCEGSGQRVNILNDKIL